MKKRLLAVMLCVCVLACTCSIQVSAADTVDETNVYELDINKTDCVMSEAMTFEEMVEYYANSAGITYQEALEFFPENVDNTNSMDYRVFSVPVKVTNEYIPEIDFFCHVSIGDGQMGITDIFSIQLNRIYVDFLNRRVSKAFAGDIEAQLVTAEKIFYIINGDFYNQGTTTGTTNGGIAIGGDSVIKFSFAISGSYTNNYYAPCYDYDTVKVI